MTFSHYYQGGLPQYCNKISRALFIVQRAVAKNNLTTQWTFQILHAMGLTLLLYHIIITSGTVVPRFFILTYSIQTELFLYSILSSQWKMFQYSSQTEILPKTSQVLEFCLNC